METDFYVGRGYVRLARLSLATILITLFISPAWAGLVRIIHTNDLHSHFEHGEKQDMGHYAAVKATIDRLKYEAWDRGEETLVLDAGDFSEGTQFFLADKGELSWKALNVMNYDAVVIGNHDYLMGQKDLDRIVGNVVPDFFLLGTNFNFNRKYKNLAKHMVRRARLERNGYWISIIGLTTDDFVYKWRVGKETITSPKSAVEKYVKEFKKDSDYVIALTHLGLKDDQKLVKATNGIDLVVGGHSHHALHKPILQGNKDGRLVPIVQAGEHGHYVGDLLVKFRKGLPARVMEYRLVPVSVNGPKEKEMERFVVDARRKLEEQYPPSWLYEHLGYTEVPMQRPERGSTPWSRIVGEGMRSAARADIVVDSPPLFGDNQPAGPVTREKLFQFYPRVFNFSSNVTLGWNVWVGEVQGWVLKIALKEAIKMGHNLSTVGVTYQIVGSKGKEEVRNIKVNGKKLSTFRDYRVAFPEGIGRAVAEMGGMYDLFIRNARSTGFSVWGATERQFRRIGGFVRAGQSVTP